MAAWNGGKGDMPPSSPNLRQMPSPDSIQPDTEENVSDQTEDVFKNFLYESYRRDQIQQQFDSTPQLPQLTNFTADPLGPASQVGRRLAKIGDDINNKYGHEFDSMINKLSINQNTAYGAFSGIAKKLLDGPINWGRILTLFSFGYRIAMRVLNFRNIQDFTQVLKNVISNIVQFVSDSAVGIARWIASQGGWKSAMSYLPSSVSWKVMMGIGVSAAIAIGAVFWIKGGH